MVALVGLLWLLSFGAANAVGQPADNFSLSPAEGGKAVSLSNFKGKPTMVVFWATWCPPCRREIPVLKTIHKDYSARGLQIVSVAIAYRETREDVVNFKKTNELPYLVLWDDDNKISEKYEVEGIPTVLLLDTKGVIRYRSHNLDQDFMAVLDGLVKS